MEGYISQRHLETKEKHFTVEVYHTFVKHQYEQAQSSNPKVHHVSLVP